MNTDGHGWVVRVLAGLILSGAALVANANTPIPNGKWSFVWTDAKGDTAKPIRVYTYRPRACDTTCPMVIVLHGMSRNASDYRDYWELLADHYKVLVVAPQFDKEQWRGTEGYNLGEIGNGERSKTVFAAIEHLFDEMRDGQASYILFGHSAGGQVAHRMALLFPENRASVIAAANSGWYTMPDYRQEKVMNPFPFSLVNVPGGGGDQLLRKALARKLVVLVGENDSDPDAENMSKSDGAMKEGATRLDRAENFFKTATTAATDLGVKLNWDLVEVPGVAHSGSSMSKAAADAVLGKK
jgi:pimeloyl-ACP methyl ester carboxylesterase